MWILEDIDFKTVHFLQRFNVLFVHVSVIWLVWCWLFCFLIFSQACIFGFVYYIFGIPYSSFLQDVGCFRIHIFYSHCNNNKSKCLWSLSCYPFFSDNSASEHWWSCSICKGPRTLHTKLQNMQLSSIHTTNFFHYCNNFFNTFLYGQRFSQQFCLKKKVVKIFVVCQGRKSYNLSVNVFTCICWRNNFRLLLICALIMCRPICWPLLVLVGRTINLSR